MQVEPVRPAELELSQLQRIFVLRALFLGDMLCCVPALRALRAAAPRAHIVLAGLPWAREFARRLGGYVDEFVEFPGFPGLPEQAVAVGRADQFLAEMRDRRFDLAIQLQGSGRQTNNVCFSIGAARTAGFYPADEDCPDASTFLPFSETESEIRRQLRLMKLLGAPALGDHLEFEIRSEDRQRLAQLLSPSVRAENFVCIHAGAKLATRRWPVERFAAVANAIGGWGYYVVLTGSRPEWPLVQQVANHLRVPHVNLCGQSDLGLLAALLERAQLVVTNDTGISHVAAAVQAPSVVIFLGSDPRRWAPLDSRRHRVIVQPVPCRPCQHADCPIGFVCAEPVTVETVLDAASSLLWDRSRDFEPPHQNARLLMAARSVC